MKPSQIDAEIITVRVFAASGSFDLFYYDASNALFLMNVPIGTSGTSFRNRLGQLPNINDYDPVVIMTTLDASGAPTTLNASIKGY